MPVSPRNDGLKLAVQYSLPPCQLGFCGPREEKNRKLLVEFAKGRKIPPSEVRRVLERFEAMYPYLRLIARGNGITDPLDERVVRAFWVGNEMLEKVAVDDLRRLITTDFVGPGRLSKEEAERRAMAVPDGAVPHHSFHVLILGSVTGRVKFTNALRDLCRIGWGKVLEVGDRRSEVRVRYKPLVSGEDGRMKLGEEVEKGIAWDKEITPGVEVGDWVSFHWGRVCDVLCKEDVSNLMHYTQLTLGSCMQLL